MKEGCEEMAGQGGLQKALMKEVREGVSHCAINNKMWLGSMPCLLPVQLAYADKSSHSDVSKPPDTKNKAKNCTRDAEGRSRCECMQKLDDIPQQGEV